MQFANGIRRKNLFSGISAIDSLSEPGIGVIETEEFKSSPGLAIP